MRRREMLMGSATVAAAMLSGCIGTSLADDTDNPSDNSIRTIRVNGAGEVTAEPDLAAVRASIEATGDDAAGVRTDLAERSDELRDALVTYGIPEDDITTIRFTIRDRIDRRPMEVDEVGPDGRVEMEEHVYYVGTHAFRIELHDIESVGEVIDIAVDAGADDIGHIQFILSDGKRDDLRQEALQVAIENARVDAETVANEIGAEIVSAHTIDTSGGGFWPVRADEAVADAPMGPDSPETVVQPDDVTVRATVVVKYEMR